MTTFLLVLVWIWVSIIWLYPAGMHAKKARKDGRLTKFWVVNLYPMMAYATVCDVAFQYTFGWMFFDLFHLGAWHPAITPLFSGRVQWHCDRSTGWRLKLALWWAKQLNVFDDHIDITR